MKFQYKPGQMCIRDRFNDAVLDNMCHLIPPIILYVLLPFAFPHEPVTLTFILKLCWVYITAVALSLIHISLSLDARWNRQQTSGNTGTGQPQSSVGYYCLLYTSTQTRTIHQGHYVFNQTELTVTAKFGFRVLVKQFAGRRAVAT